MGLTVWEMDILVPSIAIPRRTSDKKAKSTRLCRHIIGNDEVLASWPNQSSSRGLAFFLFSFFSLPLFSSFSLFKRPLSFTTQGSICSLPPALKVARRKIIGTTVGRMRSEYIGEMIKPKKEKKEIKKRKSYYTKAAFGTRLYTHISSQRFFAFLFPPLLVG